MKTRGILLFFLFTGLHFFPAAGLEAEETHPMREPAPPVLPEEEPFPSGNTYYIDPVKGSMENDGSEKHPWRTLQEVIEKNLVGTYIYKERPFKKGGTLIERNTNAPVKGGDTLVLKNGYHGELLVSGAFNRKYITIMAAGGHTPVLGHTRLSAVSRWRLKELTFIPQGKGSSQLLHVESHRWNGDSHHVIIEDCQLYSTLDASTWTKDDWNTSAINGISVSGDNMIIRNNVVKNVNNGISLNSNRGLVQYNLVENFTGDGLRGNGNDLVFEYNIVKNSYKVNTNHRDGFQSFSVRDMPPRERVVLRGNMIINYEDPDQPFRGDLQGIGCFDGPYIDWVIENNVVIVNTWHGITMLGAENCRIINNTVIDPNFIPAGPATIRIDKHKNGTPSRNCLIINNISTGVSAGKGVTAKNNLVLENSAEAYAKVFEDYASRNLHLRANSPAIDSGLPAYAPSGDHDGKKRPSGKGVDIGAYERK